MYRMWQFICIFPVLMVNFCWQKFIPTYGQVWQGTRRMGNNSQVPFVASIGNSEGKTKAGVSSGVHSDLSIWYWPLSIYLLSWIECETHSTWTFHLLTLNDLVEKWPKIFCFTPNGHSCIAMCVCSYVVTKTNKVLCKYSRANNSSISLLNLHWKFLICHTMAKFLMTEIKFLFSWLSTSILGPLEYFCGSVSARRIRLKTDYRIALENF